MLLIVTSELLSDHTETLINKARSQARGKCLKRRIKGRETRGRQKLTGKRNNEEEMMRETVGWGGGEDAVATSIRNIGRGSSIGSDSNKFGS